MVTAPHATLPKPETAMVLPLMSILLSANICLTKYKAPKPVASGRRIEPPNSRPLPVKVPVCSRCNFLYMPNI
ncbi:hypothetical protein EVA_11655 [gut metagenome]|uniref:Uncharacterized protein n=1 Tax=gut metagenome TaxID=749906 RepID=J9G082_9ZZZZ